MVKTRTKLIGDLTRKNTEPNRGMFSDGNPYDYLIDVIPFHCKLTRESLRIRQEEASDFMAESIQVFSCPLNLSEDVFRWSHHVLYSLLKEEDYL